MGVTAPGDRHSQPGGYFQSEVVFLVRRAAVDHLNGISQLEHRMVQSILGNDGQRLIGQGAVKVRAFPHMLAEHPPERMGADYKSAASPGRPAKFRRQVEPGLVLIQTECQHMAHIGIGFHCPNQDYVVAAGEPFKLVAVPGAAVFGNA